MILGLIILGPEKLPGVIRKAGKLYSEFKGAFGDTIGDLKDTAQGYKSMFESASQQATNTLRDMAQFDHDAPNEPTETIESEPEPKFIPFEIGLPESPTESGQ